MKLVTLTTDWGTSDFFAGMVKGRLYSMIPDVQVIDITHNIEPYNRLKTAFIVRNACLGFPEGTIHIIDVDSHETKERPYVVIEYDKQYYICADNGITGPVFWDKEVKIVQISMYQDSSFFNFPAYNLFCFVAAQIANGAPMDEIGFVRQNLAPYTRLSPLTHEDSMEVQIMYVDSYGNAYLNILYDDFVKILNGRKMRITVGSLVRKKLQISGSYFDSEDYGETGLVLTVSATGYLELALLHNSAEELMGIEVGAKAVIQFE